MFPRSSLFRRLAGVLVRNGRDDGLYAPEDVTLVFHDAEGVQEPVSVRVDEICEALGLSLSPDQRQVLGTLMEDMAPLTGHLFPHCDASVLHAPGECQFCDKEPAFQELRKAWGIAFTGHAPRVDPKMPWLAEVPCPSDARRGRGGAHVWPGNTPDGYGGPGA